MLKKWLLCLIVFLISLIPSDQYKAIYGVIDRFIDNIAIVLVEEQFLQLEMNIEKLPNNVQEGSIIKLEISNEEIIVVKDCVEKTKIERNKSEMLIEKLQEK